VRGNGVVERFPSNFERRLGFGRACLPTRSEKAGERLLSSKSRKKRGRLRTLASSEKNEPASEEWSVHGKHEGHRLL